tara:strand:- start:2046 stop:3035 length:990 start_codon:yes stop_codon:yes gene_type:complete
MNNSQENKKDETFDLISLIKILFEEKLLIIIICLIFGSLGYLYSTTQKSSFYSNVQIYSLADPTFKKIQVVSIFNKQLLGNILSPEVSKTKDVVNIFNNALLRKILSKVNFEKFIKEDESAESLRKYLTENSITLSSYLEGKESFVQIIKNGNNDGDPLISEFVINFPEEVQGHLLLNNYIYKCAKETFLDHVVNVQSQLKRTITRLSAALDVTLLLKMDIPTFFTKELGAVYLEGNDYMKGSIMLSKELEIAKDNLETFTKSIDTLSNSSGEEIRFTLPDAEVLWIPITQRAFIKEIPANRNKPIFLGLILGFFISLLFISKKIITRV